MLDRAACLTLWWATRGPHRGQSCHAFCSHFTPRISKTIQSPVTCRSSRTTLHLWAVSTSGRRLSRVVLWTPLWTLLSCVGWTTCSLTLVRQSSWWWTSASRKHPLHLFSSRGWTCKLFRITSTWEDNKFDWATLRLWGPEPTRASAESSVIQCLQYHFCNKCQVNSPHEPG